MPPAEQVRDALERVLESDAFARSDRARNLLRYLVEQDLAGNADRLKGFSIAVDVFGKGDSFDPATDTVVRVQAGRLRDLLAQYYASQGSDDPLRITVPRGSYVPDYEAGSVAVAEAAPPAAAAADDGGAAGKPAPRLPLMAAAAFGLVVVLVAAAIAWRVEPPPAPDEAAASADAGLAELALLGDPTGSVPSDMLPSVYIEIEPGEYGGEQVASALRRGLTAFDTVHFIARAPEAEQQHARRRIDFVFVVEPASRPGDVHLELQNIVTGTALLSRDIVVANKPQAAIDGDIAGILTTVAPASGIIYAGLMQAGAQTTLIHCLALNETFYHDRSPPAHREAYGCFEELAALELKSPLVYAELASLHVQAIVSGYRYPPDASLDQALDYARQAVQLGPNSPHAHRSMGYVLSRTATTQEALRWTRKAHELNIFDLGMAAAYGYALIFNGDYKQGTPALQHAVTIASSHPTWWDYGLFLGHFMLEDRQGAANAVSALASSGRAHYLAARLLAADGLGEREQATALVAELRADYPTFAGDPAAFYRRGNYPQDMTARLLDALRAAGLGSAS